MRRGNRGRSSAGPSMIQRTQSPLASRLDCCADLGIRSGLHCADKLLDLVIGRRVDVRLQYGPQLKNGWSGGARAHDNHAENIAPGLVNELPLRSVVEAQANES